MTLGFHSQALRLCAQWSQLEVFRKLLSLGFNIGLRSSAMLSLYIAPNIIYPSLADPGEYEQYDCGS